MSKSDKVRNVVPVICNWKYIYVIHYHDFMFRSIGTMVVDLLLEVLVVLWLPKARAFPCEQKAMYVERISESYSLKVKPKPIIMEGQRPERSSEPSQHSFSESGVKMLLRIKVTNSSNAHHTSRCLLENLGLRHQWALHFDNKMFYSGGCTI